MIEIINLSKKFKTYRKPSDRLKEWFRAGKKIYHEENWVLKNINLHIHPGESFGIIGMNGAGKSTLLKIITSTMVPTSGQVKISGRVAALLELGTGFHPDLTGRENVLINGKLLGLSEKEISDRVDDIAAFSELGEYFDRPIRTYSSGMYVRLAFSLASSVDPEILIIDEALSVGDAYFQQKCLNRILDFRKKGVTILFVSHDPGAVKLLCNRVALLSKGEIEGVGTPIEMLEMYNALLARKEGAGQEYIVKRGERDAFGRYLLSSGNQKVNITKVFLSDANGNKLEAVESGTICNIVVSARFNEHLENPTVGILIRDRMGYDIFGTNSFDLMTKTGYFTKGDSYSFIFRCKMNLGPGDYTVTAAFHSEKTHINECYEWIDRILTFKVLPRSDYFFLGVSCLEPQLSFEKL